MRPLRLTLTAFGPFAGSVEVDFEALAGHGLFLIHGPTGAGKSTLLDGMTYALYGDAKGGPERSGSSFASTLAPLERSGVALTFATGSATYRVQRFPTQLVARSRGAAADASPVQRQTEGRLERLAGDGSVAEIVAEKATETTRAIEELLGIGVEQFRQTVVLPQGAFREVVTDERAREHVLKQLFGTARFAALTAHLKAIAGERQQATDAARRERERLLEQAGVSHHDELRQRLESASASLDAAREARAAREHERRTHSDALVAGRALDARFATLDRYSHDAARLDAVQERIDSDRQRLLAANRAAALQASEERRERDQADLAAARGAHDEATETLRSTREHHAQALVALDTERGRERERSDASALAQRLTHLEADVRALGALRSTHAELLATIARQREELSGHSERRSARITEREQLRTERSTLRQHADALETQREARAGALAALEARRDIAALDAELSDLDAQSSALDAAAHGDDALLSLLRRHAAGVVRAALEPGRPCPVCGSTHHPAPHGAADADALHSALERYQEHERARQRLRTAHDTLMQRRARQLSDQGWDDALPAVDELERAHAAALSAHDDAAAATQRLRAIDEALETLGTSIEQLEPTISALSLSLQSNEKDAEAAARDIERILTQLPADASEPDAFLERLEAARARATSLERALADATEQEADRRGALAAAEARVTERLAQRERAQATLASTEQAFSTALREQGFEDEAAYAAARLGDAERSALAERIEAHDAERRTLEVQRRELTAELAGSERPDLERMQAALDGAQQAWERADEALQHAQQLHDGVARAVAELDRIDAAYREIEQSLGAAQRLAKLAAGTVAGRPRVDLETFVLQRQFHEVLQIGNTHLRTMTGGRYTLHLVRDLQRSGNGLDLEVADHFVDGVRRPAKTLSGGEGFLAALALALGLSDVAQRARHPIEALFIDEGFGSLDRESLDQVTRMLRTLPHTAGRMIGIISHVEELKRLLPVQLVVSSERNGSRLEVRIND